VTFRILMVLALSLVPPIAAQEIEMNDGTRVKGTVSKVARNRVQFRTAAGRVVLYRIQEVRRFHAADGTTKTFAGQLLDSPTPGPAQMAALNRLGGGKKLSFPELRALSEDCSSSLLEKLIPLASAKKANTRSQAAMALATAGTPETVRVALTVALEDKSAKVRRAAAQALMTATSVAAMESAKLKGEVEKGLTARDRKTRFALAWIAVHLESEKAIEVLESYTADSDHHVRETVAVLLAEHGSLAGLRVLLGMLGQKSSPALRANRNAPESVKDAIRRADRNVKIHICDLLGNLRSKEAIGALKKLSRHEDRALAEAAAKAIGKIG